MPARAALSRDPSDQTEWNWGSATAAEHSGFTTIARRYSPVLREYRVNHLSIGQHQIGLLMAVMPPFSIGPPAF
jgi:hypothetical protein